MRAVEPLRLLYATVVRARQHRVTILTEPPPPSETPPIFVVGCVRSGTSLVRRVLDTHPRIACPPESHFLRPLLDVLADRRSVLGLESMGFSRDTVIARTRWFAERFFLEYARSCGKPRWADKTPFYIESLSAIDELFAGTPRYLMLYRHGLDVAHSMTRALAPFVRTLPLPPASPTDNRDVRAAASYWARQVACMRAFQKAHPDRCFELRYEQLNAQPVEVLDEVFGFLDEPFEEECLRFNQHHHDEGFEDGRVRTTRAFEPHIGGYRAWSDEQQRAADDEAGQMLRLLGYRV